VIFLSDDAREGMQAFIDRREPDFGADPSEKP
jgi:1,4-dihydroxy-2-naphthoyl-CoA synthase